MFDDNNNNNVNRTKIWYKKKKWRLKIKTC